MLPDYPMKTARTLQYDVGQQLYDGMLLEGAPERLIIVLPDWRGCLTEYALRRGNDIALTSAAAVCVTDAYGVNQRPIAFANDAEVWIERALADPIALRDQLARQIAGLRVHLDEQPKYVAVVGYCLGGALALEVGRKAIDIDAVVSVHGIPSTNQMLTKYPGKTAFLAIHGADDPIIELDHLRSFETEMAAVGADWQSHVIGGARHGFTDEEADPQGSHQRYDARAAAHALQVTNAFLDKTAKRDD